MASNRSRRLIAALTTVIALGILATVGAYLRTGQGNWGMAIIRTALTGWLSWYAIVGRSWARWSLVALFGLGILVTLGYFAAAGGSLLLIAVLLVLVGVYAWAIVELVSAELAAPKISRV